MRLLFLAGLCVFCTSCLRLVPGPVEKTEIHVAAAANLTRVLEEIDQTFERNTHVHVVPTFGATAQLTQQIESGAPFDIFLSADVSHVDELVNKGLAPAASKEIYAKGQLAVYAPGRRDLHSLQDLVTPKPLEIFVAKPELAPYGAAAIEALKAAKVWSQLEPHTKYASSITAAKQYADTGNCDAAITAYSLVFDQTGAFFLIDQSLYQPILQAMCIMKSSTKMDAAKLYASFLGSQEARMAFNKFGYKR